MIEELATVTRLSDSHVWLQADRRIGCERCESGQGCGGGLLGKLVSSRGIDIAVPLNQGAHMPDLVAGDTVVIGFHEASLLQGSLLAYGLPMLVMLVGAGLANTLLASDLSTIAGAIGGAGLGWFAARRLSARYDFQPRLLRKSTPDEASGCWAGEQKATG